DGIRAGRVTGVQTCALPISWNFVTPAAAVAIPRAAQFAVKAGGRPVGVTTVGFKRRALSAPLQKRDLHVGSWLYLRLDREISPRSEERRVGKGWRRGWWRSA